MKLLLTSNGLSNDPISQALVGLVGKPAEETVVAFVPTAMNPVEGGKWWFINDLWNIKQHGFKEIDIVDISALPRENWQLRLVAADVLFFSGGSAYHLMYWMRRSGLRELLPELLNTRVYAGISAGSSSTGPDISIAARDTAPFAYDNSALKVIDGKVEVVSEGKWLVLNDGNAAKLLA